MSYKPVSPSWQQIKLKDICELITDGKHGDCADEQGSGYYFLSAKDIVDGRILFENARQITEVDFLETHKRTRFQPFDVLFTNSGTIGRMAIAKDEVRTYRATFQKSVAILKPLKSVVQPQFLYYLLLGESRRLTDYAGGTAQKNLLLRDLREFLVSLPDLLIQRKIASILSAYDDLIENNTRRIKILEETAQSIYGEWFVNFRFPGHEKVSMVDSKLGKIPKGWEIIEVAEVIQRISAGKRYENKTVLSVGKIPVLDQGQSGIIGFHNDEPGLVASEDAPVVVFANHTCYQRLIYFPFSAIQNVLPFIPNPKYQRDIYWLHWATKDLIHINDYKGHWPEFISKNIIFPPVKITDEFGQIIKPMSNLIYRLGIVNSNLCQTRDLLLPRLISGELDVTDLDIAINSMDAGG